jgi:hypothetical protein
MSKQTMNLVHTRQDGEKKFHNKVGIVLIDQNQDGTPKISVKINSMPVGAEWNGWLNAYPIDRQQQGGGQQGGGGGYQQPQQGGYQQNQQQPQAAPGFTPGDMPF